PTLPQAQRNSTEASTMREWTSNQGKTYPSSPPASSSSTSHRQHSFSLSRTLTARSSLYFADSCVGSAEASHQGKRDGSSGGVPRLDCERRRILAADVARA